MNGVTVASYVPWYGKKREKLAKHEREFAAILASGPDTKTMADCIEAIRAAQVRVLKAKREMLAPSERNAVAVANLNAKIERWRAMTGEKIIEEFRKRLRQSR